MLKIALILLGFFMFLQTHSCFQLLTEVTGKSLSSIIEPHKELLVDMIPPRKHLLKHQPINTQIALMVRLAAANSAIVLLF